jgi:UDP-N-acetylmuramyl pentapeptide phosphotransferase/UDP-N-acetylglucosamine-1-phosphate transferase
MMMPPALVWFAGVVVAFTAAAMLTTRLVGILLRAGVIDASTVTGRPRPVPRGGGLAIIAVVVGAALVATIRDATTAGRAMAALMPAMLVAAVSWRDDISPLPARLRLAVHLLAAIIAVAILGPAERVDLGTIGSLDLGAWGWPLSVLWIVGMTNAFNFMDGIDGIAGIVTMAVGAAVAVAAAMLDAPAVAVLATALAAGAGGFLTVNWPPARIFMGDVGSTFCGFLLGALTLAVDTDDVPRMLPVSVVSSWPFLFDTMATVLGRLVRGHDLLRPLRSRGGGRTARRRASTAASPRSPGRSWSLRCTTRPSSTPRPRWRSRHRSSAAR